MTENRIRSFGTVGGVTQSPPGLDVGAGGTPRNGDNASLSSSVSGTTLKLVAPAGQYDGVDDTVTITDADFVAAKILTGTNLFGLAGSAAKCVTGTFYTTGDSNIYKNTGLNTISAAWVGKNGSQCLYYGGTSYSWGITINGVSGGTIMMNIPGGDFWYIAVGT